MIVLALLGGAMLIASAALWIKLDAARFNRRNQYGTMLFPTYRHAFAFQIGQRVGAPAAKLLFLAGAVALFVSVMAGPV